MIGDPDDGAERAALDEFDFIGVVKIPMLFFEIGVDVPGVPSLRLVDEGLQEVAAGGIFGPPVSVSAGARASVPLRLSNKLVMHPVVGSIFRRMNSFSSESGEAFRRE